MTGKMKQGGGGIVRSMVARSLMTQAEFAAVERRFRNRKTLTKAEIAEFQHRDVACTSCGRPMPALRLLRAGYEECGICNRLELVGDVEIGMARAAGHAVLEY